MDEVITKVLGSFCDSNMDFCIDDVSTCPCTFQLLKRFYTILNLLCFLLQHLTVWISLQDMVHICIGKNTAIIVDHVSYACM